MIEDTVLWNAILTGGIGIIAWIIRSCMMEVNRLTFYSTELVKKWQRSTPRNKNSVTQLVLSLIR